MQFLVLYFVGAQLLMPQAITLDSYSESLQPICATKPLGGGNYAQQLSSATAESGRLSDFLDDLLVRVKGTAIAS